MPSLAQKTPLDYDDMSSVIVKNVSVDLEKIDINKFRKKMNAITSRITKDELYYNISRRQQFLDPGDKETPTPEYFWGLGQYIRRKCLDLMLQVLYMARHKVKKLHENIYFSTTDTGFRIAYTYRLLIKTHQQMLRYFSYSWRTREKYDDINKQIMLHGKVTRLHVDFCYFWWVLIRVDGAFKKSTNVRKQKQDMKDLVEQFHIRGQMQNNIGPTPSGFDRS